MPTLTVARVFVQHEGIAGLNLSVEDSVPQLVSINCPAGSAFTLVALIELFKLFTPDFVLTRGLVRAEQRPLPISFDTLHAAAKLALTQTLAKLKVSQEVRDPKGIEKVTSTDLLLPVVLAEVKELEYIVMPRL